MKLTGLLRFTVLLVGAGFWGCTPELIPTPGPITAAQGGPRIARRDWFERHFTLTDKSLVARRADGTRVVIGQSPGERWFVSPQGQYAVRIRSAGPQGGEVALLSAADRAVYEARYPSPEYVGDVLVSESGWSALVLGYGPIEQYHARALEFVSPQGPIVAQASPESGIADCTASLDGRVLLVWSPESRKDPNHHNRLTLYSFDGGPLWTASIGRLNRRGQSVVGSQAVYSTTQSPAHILCHRRSDGQLVYDRLIDNGSPPGFGFYRYMALSQDEGALLLVGWGDIVAIDAASGSTRWHRNLSDPALAGKLASRNKGAYSIACSADGSSAAALAACYDAIINDGLPPCRHWLLSFGPEGQLTGVLNLGITTDILGEMAWHRLIVPRFVASDLHVLDGLRDKVLILREGSSETVEVDLSSAVCSVRQKEG